MATRTRDRLAALLLSRRALTSASSRRRRARKAPKARPPVGVAIEYQRALRDMMGELYEMAMEILSPHLEELAEPPRLDARSVRLDSPRLIARLIGDIVVAHGVRFPESRISQMVLEFGRKVTEWNRREVSKQFRAVLGIEYPEPGEAIALQMEAFRSANVNLITRMQREALDRIRETLERRSRQGARVEDLRRELMEQEGLSKSRAQLIARDQVLKYNGELTQLRQKEAGVERYEWSTSQDERVREGHRRLNGTIQRWDDPPIVDPKTGRRHHPGEDYQCRCVAIPVFDLPDD